MDPSVSSKRAEMLAREADWHFQTGRKAYQEGDENSARKEFDRAVDLLLNAPDTPVFRAVLDKKLDQLVQAIHRLDLAGLGSADPDEPSFEKSPLEDIPQLTFPVDPKLKNKVLEEVRATASQLPLQVNDAVLSYINYFSTERGRRILVYGLRRAGRYRSLIQRILDEEGVPQELIFLAQAESGFLPRAVSRKRATGMWQFVQLRGQEYGLKQSPYSDDRLDPEKATRAAARHLREFLADNGFEITDEDLVLENRRFYPILLVRRGAMKGYTPLEYEFAGCPSKRSTPG
jgi:membrane-bound lytic murein transglycosylase D